MDRFTKKHIVVASGICLAFVVPLYVTHVNRFPSYDSSEFLATTTKETVDAQKAPAVLDTALYDKKMTELANYPSDFPTTTKKLYPTKAVYPNAGALLPFNRIIAFYGNFYAKGMGVLGEYPKDEMLAKLRAVKKQWELADPSTPVIPAIHYIDVTAQGSAGADGKYRTRMPDDQIDYALSLAKEVDGIVFVDIQVALSTLPQELPLLDKYFKMPNIHLGIDPEFSMKTGARPGTVVGTYDASDVNYAIRYLSKIVKENNLPPKILIIHRYTQKMLTNYQNITPTPEVQVIIHMDGWGDPAKKIGTYDNIVAPEPVQFTGFKLFYKNDLWEPSTRMLTPKELLELTPRPIYIQYQ